MNGGASSRTSCISTAELDCGGLKAIGFCCAFLCIYLCCGAVNGALEWREATLCHERLCGVSIRGLGRREVSSLP